jgi:hypothetical protein
MKNVVHPDRLGFVDFWCSNKAYRPTINITFYINDYMYHHIKGYFFFYQQKKVEIIHPTIE